MTTTTPIRSHHATTGPPVPLTTGPQGSAFLAEVRLQWAAAARQLDDALARGDEGAQQDAGDRLEELRELLTRHDLSVSLLRLAEPI